MPDPAYKTCAKCKESKPHSEFYRDKREKDGLYTCCKRCHLARTRSWEERNVEHRRQIKLS